MNFQQRIEELRRGLKEDLGYEETIIYKAKLSALQEGYNLRLEETKNHICSHEKDTFECDCFIDGYEKAKAEYENKIKEKVEELKKEIFATYDWGKNHGNGELMARSQITKIIDQVFSNSQQKCNGGQTISDNVGSSRNPLQGKVLATSETSAYGLQATSERSDYKTGSNLETTGDVRLKSSEVVSLLNDGTPRSSNSADNNSDIRNREWDWIENKPKMVGEIRCTDNGEYLLDYLKRVHPKAIDLCERKLRAELLQDEIKFLVELKSKIKAITWKDSLWLDERIAKLKKELSNGL